MTDPITLEEVLGIDWSDIAKRGAKVGDQILGFDESGNWIRLDSNLIDQVIIDLVSDVADLQTLTGVAPGAQAFGAFPGDILPANQTLYALLATIEAAIEAVEGGDVSGGYDSVALSGGTATLNATPSGPVVGITFDNRAIRETTHFSRVDRVITIGTWGDPATPYAADGDVTWLYPVANDTDRKFDAGTITSGQSTLSAVPQSPVVGITFDNRVLREDSHFTVDEAGVVTIGTHGDPAQPYAVDGEVTWIYSTAAAAAAAAERGAFEFDNTDGTEINSDTIGVVVITDDNENDTFTIVGTNHSTLVIQNERDDLKTIAGAEVGGQTTVILAKVGGSWRALS